jgi:transposase InsO family protein
MGLKGAPAYFQKQMVTVVLVGLVYMICEVYLDDVIVHGRTQIELVDRLRLVFERLRKFKLTLNPDKCQFGLQSIEYVGHVIDETGISMSTDRIHNVLQFDEPRNLRFLKQFLGIANYFRQHIVNYAMVTRPLHQLLLGYTKKKKSVEVKWTDETRQAFKDTKQAINECKKLYFLQKEGLITVRTDASDYAIGAYLCQMQDGVERPIEFVSKSLVKEQIRWSTPEKEGYAIYFCLMELECHLRGRKFLLQTDHANLTHLNLSGSPKVIRWKLALQEFDFEIQHIKGVHNTVADALSRLRPVDTIHKEVLYGVREFTKDIPKGIYRHIQMCHSPLNGHWGVEKTLNLLRQRLRGNVADRKSLDVPIIPPDLNPDGGGTVATYSPMYAINVDTMGPFMESSQGFTNIIVIVDCFTRFVELYPSIGATGLEAAHALLHHFGRYGSPSIIKSDNGPQFVNELIEEFMRAVGTDHELSLAYSSEENGIVERANKEVLRHLKMMIFNENSKEKWSEYLPLVQRILNSTTHSSTGISPAEALFGNNIKLEHGIFLLPESIDRPKETRMSEWVGEMLINQAAIIDIAQTNQFERDWKHHYGTAHEEPPKFEKNSYVLVNNVSKFTGKPPSKLHFHWKGPMRVVNNDVPNKYTLQDLVTLKLADYHVTSLKKFCYDPVRHVPAEVANRDENTFTVEEILSHSGKLNDKETLLFRVKWLGMGAEENSDETYETLKRNEYLHAYLTKIGARHLIPRAFRAVTVRPVTKETETAHTINRKRKIITEDINKIDRPVRIRRQTARFKEDETPQTEK